MTDFHQQDLSGSTFREVDLSGAEFDRVHFAGATFREVNFAGATLTSAYFAGTRMNGVEAPEVSVNGEFERFVVNGVDVVPLISAELDRRHPERLKLRPTTPDGYREAWEVLDGLWSETVDRARQLPSNALHESVDGEWSFIETLRHLAFATASWLCRQIQGDQSPWHPLDLPWDEMPDTPGVPRDRQVRPSLDEGLAHRAERFERVRTYLGELTPEELSRVSDPMPPPGWPHSEAVPVQHALDVLLNEEWWHRRFAERDLAVLLESPEPDGSAGS